MTADVARHMGAGVAARALADLGERLGVHLPAAARPGADLAARSRCGEAWPARAAVLRAADGWVHPGPPTAWADFRALARSLGAPAPDEVALPDVSSLPAEVMDAEAGAWMLPVVAVRVAPAPAPVLPEPTSRPDLRGAVVVVLGTAWAAPLAGLLVRELGARVVRVDDPRRPDPFPLRDVLASGQERVAPNLATPGGRGAFRALLAGADLLVDGYTPRVLDNAGFGDDTLARELPHLARLRIAAFTAEDRPGYGPAAECRGGWAARHDPPRLARSSVADPVAGLLAALEATVLLAAGRGAARVSLEGAVGHLLAAEWRTAEPGTPERGSA